MTLPHPVRRVPPSEEGYILLWVMFLLVVFTIGMSVAVPVVAREIQLDRERETMARGKQYIRAVQLYYRKFHAYPPNPDALVKTNEIRFLRKKYIDPATGKDDWKPVRYGQNKAPTAMGFFGQPLAGNASTIAGIGPSGGNSNSTLGGTGSTIGPGSTIGSTSTGSATGTGTSTGTSSTSGQTFGGAGIIGFTPGGTKSSILIYKKKTHYNDWEFVYDPLADIKTQTGSSGTGTSKPITDTSTPVGTPPKSPGP
jgi:type II secretory pathway pseudopilin PulG